MTVTPNNQPSIPETSSAKTKSNSARACVRDRQCRLSLVCRIVNEVSNGAGWTPNKGANLGWGTSTIYFE